MFLPSMGTFVVISIDPIATLDCAENKEMSEICKGLTNKKYVAYVDKVRWFFSLIPLSAGVDFFSMTMIV